MIRRKFIFKFGLSCLCAFLFSCGLETYTFTYPVLYVYNNPLYSSSDSTTYYCSFQTNESKQNDNFVGTDIYYRIYNNTSTLVSNRSVIVAANTTNNSGAAAQLMATYGFKQLKMKPSLGYSIFIPATGTNRNVYFRLKDMYLTSDVDFKAAIKISGSYLYGGTQLVVPCRYDGSKTFDFFDDDNSDVSNKIDVEPVNGDEDFTFSSSATDSDTYYVQLFAVGMSFNSTTLSANDLSCASDLVDLGSIPIIKNK